MTTFISGSVSGGRSSSLRRNLVSGNTLYLATRSLSLAIIALTPFRWLKSMGHCMLDPVIEQRVIIYVMNNVSALTRYNLQGTIAKHAWGSAVAHGLTASPALGAWPPHSDPGLSWAVVTRRSPKADLQTEMTHPSLSLQGFTNVQSNPMRPRALHTLVWKTTRLSESSARILLRGDIDLH